MQLTFDNNYVLAVVVFMLSMLFCKNLLECMQACLQVWQGVMCKDLCFCPCVNVSHAALVKQCVFTGMCVFSVFQPLILLVVQKTTEKIQGYPPFWTVNLGVVVFDVDTFTHSQNHTAVVQKPVSKLSFSEVDAVLLVMPYMLLAASSTWTWVSLQQQGFFNSDPEWNTELFADPRMQLYELLYCGELFMLFFCLLCISADPADIEYSFVCALVLTFLLMYFCAQSHQQRVADPTEHILSMVMFSLLCTLVSLFVVQHWSGGCVAKRYCGVLLVLVVMSLTIMHMSTHENTAAGTVIFVRSIVANTCSLYFIVFVSQNPNSLCG